MAARCNTKNTITKCCYFWAENTVASCKPSHKKMDVNVTAINHNQSIQLEAVIARAVPLTYVDIPNPRDLVENLWNLHHTFHIFNHWLGHLDTKTNPQTKSEKEGMTPPQLTQSEISKTGPVMQVATLSRWFFYEKSLQVE